METTADLGDGVDFAAAGVKDLNNFKGYHNQDAHKDEEADRYTDAATGAHFLYEDFCKRLLAMVKNKGQEKKILSLTGVQVQLDQSFYFADPENRR